MTGWAVLGLESAGINPLDLDHGDATPISYLAGNVGEITTTGDIERTILVLRGAGLNPRHFQGRDLVGRLLARRGERRLLGRTGEPDGVRDPRPAGCRSDERHRALGRLASRSPELRRRLGLRRRQRRATPTPPARCCRRLAAAGSSSAAISEGRLAISAASSGRAAASRCSGGVVNAQSTAWAVQGLVAAGVSPSSVRERRPLPARLPRLRAGRATATTGTRHRATRLRSGSPARPCSPPTALHSRSRRAPAGGVEGSACRPPLPRLQPRTDRVRRASKPDSEEEGRRERRNPARRAAARPVVRARWLLPPRALTMTVGGGIPGWVIVVAAAVLAATAVWGGWVLYRRRLPANPGGPGH